jgi:hypothetical protein
MKEPDYMRYDSAFDYGRECYQKNKDKNPYPAKCIIEHQAWQEGYDSAQEEENNKNTQSRKYLREIFLGFFDSEPVRTTKEFDDSNIKRLKRKLDKGI